MEEEFRDKIATVDDEGKRIWIFPKKPKGSFYSKRKLVSYLLLILLFTIPYIKIDGEPFLMFNILERKFSIFGFIFWAQDLYLFALTMIVLVVFVILFTVIFGRLFCGWVCPQTIFMEMVFRRIEYWIEGDWKQQKKLANQPWNKEKITKRALKHGIFFIISFLIANTFLSYIIGYEQVWAIAADNPINHIGGLIAILVFTTVFFLVFLKLREQVCTTICPYGRLQGVLLDRRSLNVIYDYVRGEKRAKFDKREDRSKTDKGDCIDCKQCVNVCPTGIDIRNGIQLECVNCTACIDACDEMMEAVNLPKGLIRYDSEEGVKTGVKFSFTARVKAYSVLLLGLLVLLTSLVINRSDFETTILRTRGTLFQKAEKGQITNIYDITITNKTSQEFKIELKVLDKKGDVKVIGDPITLEQRGQTKSKFMVYLNKQELNKMNSKVQIGVYGNGQLVDEVTTTFIGPR
jgi:cytochrome c oxidase accessory protein FixG